MRHEHPPLPFDGRYSAHTSVSHALWARVLELLAASRKLLVCFTRVHRIELFCSRLNVADEGCLAVAPLEPHCHLDAHPQLPPSLSSSAESTALNRSLSCSDPQSPLRPSRDPRKRRQPSVRMHVCTHASVAENRLRGAARTIYSSQRSYRTHTKVGSVRAARMCVHGSCNRVRSS